MFTIWSVLYEKFIFWFGLARFCTIGMLSIRTIAKNVQQMMVWYLFFFWCVCAWCAFATMNFGNVFCRSESSRSPIMGIRVTQLRNARLPLSMRMNWNTIITIPAMCRAYFGKKENQGTIVWTVCVRATLSL